VTGAVSALLAALLLALAAPAMAQSPPSCPPDKLSGVNLRTEDDGVEGPLVATHEVQLSAEIAAYATNIQVTPQAGVHVLKKNSDGSIVRVFAPTTPTFALTVSWRQSADPSNSEETATCSGQRSFSLPVLAASPARGVSQPNPGPERGDFTFAVAPTVKRPNLLPLEISVRSTGHARYPRARERLRTMVVPMRTGEQVRYGTRLPGLANITTAQKCRFWWLTCGPAFAHVDQLNVDNRGRPDLSGSNSILRSLARTQPARWAARFGIVVTATPGARRPQQFGYDVQVRQAGRLLARVRRAGRCVTLRRSSGLFDQCTIARKSTLLR
jgi:hypothetical protein